MHSMFVTVVVNPPASHQGSTPTGDPVINTTIQSIYLEGGPRNADILACKIGFTDCSEVLGGDVFQRVGS